MRNKYHWLIEFWRELGQKRRACGCGSGEGEDDDFMKAGMIGLVAAVGRELNSAASLSCLLGGTHSIVAGP